MSSRSSRTSKTASEPGIPDAPKASALAASPTASAVGAQANLGPLAELEQELACKNSLVETLTEQLERAAEEIDRMQRSGADRRRGGGLPSDLIDDQRQVMKDMQRIVQQWEDLQAGLAIGRIEIQLTELREFVGERLDNPRVMSAFVESSEPPAVITEHASLSTSRLLRSESNDAPATAGGLSAWEQMKSQMLDLPSEAAEGSSVDGAIPAPEPLPPAPIPIDEATADLSTLRTAVYERDAYIAACLRRLRAAEEITLPQDWSQFEGGAPEQAEAMQRLTTQLEETLRLAEVEVSLERAQLARAQMQVAAQQEALAKHLKRLGVSSVEELAAANSGAAAPDRRWSRFLGGNK